MIKDSKTEFIFMWWHHIGGDGIQWKPHPYFISLHHNNDVIMSTMASQITGLTIVYSTVYSDTDQRKHQSSGSLAFVRGIHRWPMNSPHKGPVTQKMFPFDDVIMLRRHGMKMRSTLLNLCDRKSQDHYKELPVMLSFNFLLCRVNCWANRRVPGYLIRYDTHVSSLILH